MRDILISAVFLFMFPVSLYSAHLGVLLWIWVALAAPNDLFYSGTLSGIPYNKLVAIATLLLVFLGRGRKRFYHDALIVMCGLFGFWVCLAYFLQEYPNNYSDLIFDRFWKELVLAMLITGVLCTRHRLHNAAIAAALGFGLPIARESLIFMLTAGGHQVLGTANTGDNNGLALAILMVIPLILYAARNSAERWVRLTFQVTAGLAFVTVIATFSRGGFVGLVVLAFLIMGNSKRKFQTFAVLGVFALLAYTLAPHSYFERVDTIGEATQDDSFLIRLVAWKINFLLALDHPLLGAGPYGSLAWQNWIRYLGESMTFLFPTPWVEKTYVAHSIYFQVLGDTGFIGFFLFAGMLFTAVMMCRRTRRMARGEPSLAWAADLARSLEISMMVYCVAGAALSLIYFELLFIILGLVSATHRVVAEQVATQTVPRRAGMPVGLAPAYGRSLA